MELRGNGLPMWTTHYAKLAVQPQTAEWPTQRTDQRRRGTSRNKSFAQGPQALGRVDPDPRQSYLQAARQHENARVRPARSVDPMTELRLQGGRLAQFIDQSEDGATRNDVDIEARLGERGLPSSRIGVGVGIHPLLTPIKCSRTWSIWDWASRRFCAISSTPARRRSAITSVGASSPWHRRSLVRHTGPRALYPSSMLRPCSSV
jgi:hypothetical protein